MTKPDIAENYIISKLKNFCYLFKKNQKYNKKPNAV